MSQHQSVAACVPQLCIFPTDVGWFGLVGLERRVWTLSIGHASADEVRNSLRRNGLWQADGTRSVPATWDEDDWFPELRLGLQQYCEGADVDFRNYNVQLPQQTRFQKSVIAAARRIPYGRTMTYQQLAAKAGSPGAARAVGNVMACNRAPIIIPCHRVVASAGGLGGYSAPQGIELKRRLLELESGK